FDHHKREVFSANLDLEAIDLLAARSAAMVGVNSFPDPGGCPLICMRRIPCAELWIFSKGRARRLRPHRRFTPFPPRRARAQHPEDAVHLLPLVRDAWSALAAIRKQGVENAPFASVRSPRIKAAPPARKAALESVIYEETVNTVLDAEFSDRILISVLVALKRIK